MQQGYALVIPLMSDLEAMLERLGLGQYAESFIAEGFDTWDTVIDITESDLYVVIKVRMDCADSLAQ